MNLQPLNNNVIIKAVAPEEVTKSGILLPGAAKNEKPEQGEVIAVGPGKLLDNGSRATLSVQVGNKVIFKKYAPDEIKVESEEYLVVNETDILAIIK